MKKDQLNFKTPLYISLIIIVGMIAGSKFKLNLLPKSNTEDGSIYNEVVGIVKENYVDKPNLKKINKEAIERMLKELDPHSDFVPAEEVKSSNAELEGNFEGIGIEFNIINDTVVIISALSGGPAQKVGLSTGDKIIKVGEKFVSGMKISNEELSNQMRGEKGTPVSLQIQHPFANQLVKVEVRRDVIPINSVDLAYMVSRYVGYIKISRFGTKTIDEFRKELISLKKSGMEKLILDLRGNPGGYLSTAVTIADEFLPEGKEIMYTLGRHKSKEEYIAKKNGLYEKGRLVILIDEGSASASEIVAGAIQDQDRGLLIGRRSFGKGLVQEPFVLSDGSALRLTIARYYIPSGRSIQRSYKNGTEKYFEEAEKRFLEIDSEKYNPSKEQVYFTAKGRKVYGGGGVNPDVIIQKDSTLRKKSLKRLLIYDLLYDYSLAYCIKNKIQITEKFGKEKDFIESFKIPDVAVESFITILKSKGINPNDIDNKFKEIIKQKMKGQVSRTIFGYKTQLKIENLNDPFLKEAIIQG